MYFRNTKVYFQSTKVYSRSTKVYSPSTKVYFQSTSILSNYTSILSKNKRLLWKYKSILWRKNPKTRLLRVLFDSIDLLALFGVYAGIIFTFQGQQLRELRSQGDEKALDSIWNQLICHPVWGDTDAPDGCGANSHSDLKFLNEPIIYVLL